MPNCQLTDTVKARLLHADLAARGFALALDDCIGILGRIEHQFADYVNTRAAYRRGGREPDSKGCVSL